MNREFGARDQIGYIFGDMAGSFVNLTFDAFFLLFTTYVLNMDPKFMSALFLFARLFDAINDPLIGSLPDRYKLGKSKDKFKPYIKLFMWPLALSIIMGFADINGLDINKKIWVSIAYILYGVSYTGTSMPFGAMASVITKKPNERAKLSAARAIGGTIVGYGFLGIIPLFIWYPDKSPNAKGYMLVSLIAAVLCIVSYLILCKLTTERYSNEVVAEKKDYKFFEVVRQALTNRAMLGIMFASIGSLIYITGNSQFGSFVYKEFYKAPKMLTTQLILQIPITLISFMVVPYLSKKFGKRNTLTVAILWNLAISLYIFLVPIKSVMVYITINTLANIGQTFFIMLVWAFVSEAIDYNEYKNMTRADGTLYSVYTFSRKIGSTIASTGATALLASIGFVVGSQAQSTEVIESIRMIGTGIPVVACIMEIIGLRLIYHIDNNKANDINKELERRRNEKN